MDARQAVGRDSQDSDDSKDSKELLFFGVLGVLGVFGVLYHVAMHLLRLPGRKNCDRVRVKGALWKGKHLNVRWLAGVPYHLSEKPTTPAIYVGVLSSTKLDKSAVKRNRMRRRCREALRLLVAKRPDPAAADRSLQLLLLPRSSSLGCTFNELSDEVSRFLSSVHS